MSKKNQERKKLQNKAGQVSLKSSDLIAKMKDEIILEAKAIATGVSNHLGRLVQLTKELIEEEAGE
jgi:hypothetical protein